MNIETRLLALTVICVSCLHFSAHAALRTWTGGGANANWTTAANWGGTAPVAGDDLQFPASAAQPSNTNNFPQGTIFNSLIFSAGGYSLNGNSIALNAGIIATNGANNYILNSLILNSNQTFTINIGSQNLFLPNAINLNGNNLTFNIGSASAAQVQAVVSGAGGLIKTGPGTVALYASNTFSGSAQLLQGFINLYDGHALGDTNGNTITSSSTTLTFANPITVAEPLVLAGILNSAGGGTKTLNGTVMLTDPNVTVHVVNGAPLTINGVVSGTGGFTKDLADVLTLNANNTYTGTTTLNAGTLLVNGLQPASPILLNLGLLGGTGTVGTVTCTNLQTCNIAPGTISTPGILTCSNLTLNSAATFVVKLNGPAPGTGYDQLNVNGIVSLSNALLSGSVGFTPAIGESFVILNNDGNDPIIGTFNGATNGAVLNLGGYAFQISYVGGTGNDVVLTRISPPTYLSSLTRLTNGSVTLGATGALANFNYTIVAATNLSSGVWSNIGSAIATSGGFLGFIDDQARFFPRRFYRVVSP